MARRLRLWANVLDVCLAVGLECGMDAEQELPGMPEKRAPRPGSMGWAKAEWHRFRTLSAIHGGLTQPSMAAMALGVSRQRVHQLVQEDLLTVHYIFGKPYIACNELADFRLLERDTQTRYAMA